MRLLLSCEHFIGLVEKVLEICKFVNDWGYVRAEIIRYDDIKINVNVNLWFMLLFLLFYNYLVLKNRK